jgi:glutamate synthase (NADPH/NADH) large chain
MSESTTTSLYDPAFERDSCGFGLIANLDDQPSHWVVQTAIKSLTRLTHRGAVAADGKTGDGCGLLIKFPQEFLRSVAIDLGFRVNDRFAAGTVFLSRDLAEADCARGIIDAAVSETGLEVAGWREVPIDPSVCGELARRSLPRIEQVFVNAPNGMQRGSFNRLLFLARRRAENHFPETDQHSYVASLSSVTISYKGMVMPEVLADFYSDLRDVRLKSSVCLFHQRFSTNTLPQWRLAQPFRFLAHNGEINTIHRFVEPRQHAGGNACRWHGRFAGNAVADSSRVAGQGHDEPGRQGLLRVLRPAHGTLGRARGHRADRRQVRGLLPGS